MMDLFADLHEAVSVDEALSVAKKSEREGNLKQATRQLLSALMSQHARENLYATAARELFDAFVQQREYSAALSVAWYFQDSPRESTLLEHVPLFEQARSYAAWAERSRDQDARRYHRQSAELFERDGRLVRAAIQYERAGDMASARTLWSRLTQRIDQLGRPYESGLAQFNVARANLEEGNRKDARRATVAAVGRLEEAADRLEHGGQRERAFDCYHVLISIGELTGEFEHVLEGCVNAIRILSEDNLRYHALRLQAHAIRLAEASDELAAAATLARELTNYAKKQRLQRIAASGTVKQAELWEQLAKLIEERQGPPQMVENALLAAVLAHAERDQYGRIAGLYRKLAEVNQEPGRSAHYQRAAQRFRGQRDRDVPTEELYASLGRHVGPPDLWHVDLLEWENAGQAAEACADVLLSSEDADDRITRRAALVGRLAALAARQASERQQEAAAALTATHLANIGLYSLLHPLETLYQHESAQVRHAAVRALGRYFYKRTFVTLELAVVDESSAVREEAIAAIGRLRFEHAFEPLARIYRTTSNGQARLAALAALARVDVLDAAELMLGVLSHGGPEERRTAVEALKVARGSHFFELARGEAERGSPQLRSALGDIFQARGQRL